MRLLMLLLAALPPLAAAQAFSPTGLAFQHHDWELACDNTGTCRAAGYQSDADDNAVSVLLTRKAGPGQPVEGHIQLASFGTSPAIEALPPKFRLALTINGKSMGTVFGNGGLDAELSREQTQALVAALAKRATIRMTHGRHVWKLSDQGAAAVMLKMDEYQGRVGTPGALLKKGTQAEASVPAAVTAPIFKSLKPVPALPGDKQFLTKQGKSLLAELRASISADDCEKLHSDEDGTPEISAERLAPGKMLVTSQCWLAAYNFGSAYWIVNDKPPFQPVLVTSNASEASQGRIYENHKARGLGDCWSTKTLGWDGTRFRVISQATTGMCKLIAPGGPWSLPTIVTDEK